MVRVQCVLQPPIECDFFFYYLVEVVRMLEKKGCRTPAFEDFSLRTVLSASREEAAKQTLRTEATRPDTRFLLSSNPPAKMHMLLLLPLLRLLQSLAGKTKYLRIIQYE